jgi:hypothetical protein
MMVPSGRIEAGWLLVLEVDVRVAVGAVAAIDGSALMLGYVCCVGVGLTLM